MSCTKYHSMGVYRLFVGNPQVFALHWKSYTFECSQSFSAFSMNKISNNFLLSICFLSSRNDVLLLKIPHGSSRLTHDCTLKNLIRRPHSSEEKGRGKGLLPCVCSAFYCTNVKWFDVMDSSLSKQNLIKICLHFALTLLCIIRLWSFLWPDGNLW